MPVAEPELAELSPRLSPCGLSCKVPLCFRPHGGSLPGTMAALHSTPDSPAAQLEPVEDGSECDADPEEEEEEKGDKEVEVEEEQEEVEEEEEVTTQVQEKVAEMAVEASLEDIGDDGDNVEEVLAEEQTLSSGTQEWLSNGADAQSPVLQGKGKNKDSATAGGGGA